MSGHFLGGDCEAVGDGGGGDGFYGLWEDVVSGEGVDSVGAY